MTIPTSGSISFAQLQSEFGGSHPISLSEYRRNGTLVDLDDHAPNVPTSGTVSLSQYRGSYDYVWVFVDNDPCSGDHAGNYDVYGNYTGPLDVCTGDPVFGGGGDDGC